MGLLTLDPRDTPIAFIIHWARYNVGIGGGMSEGTGILFATISSRIRHLITRPTSDVLIRVTNVEPMSKITSESSTAVNGSRSGKSGYSIEQFLHFSKYAYLKGI